MTYHANEAIFDLMVIGLLVISIYLSYKNIQVLDSMEKRLDESLREDN